MELSLKTMGHSIFKGKLLWVDIENRYYVADTEINQGFPLLPQSDVTNLRVGEIYDFEIVDFNYDLLGVKMRYPCAKIIEYNTNYISKEDIDEIESNTAKFMNWFLRHYSTSNEGAMLGYVDSMNNPVSSEQIIKAYIEHIKTTK